MNYYRPLISFSIIVLLYVAPVPARTISGRILSDSDSTAVAGASLKLFDNGEIVGGGFSDTDGIFLLNTDSKSGLLLKISEAFHTPLEVIISQGGNVKLGNIYLSQGVMLDEVTVEAAQIIESGGKTIIYPSASDTKASDTSLSLIQKLPLAGLQANPVTRALDIDGGKPFILINGVPSDIDDFNALKPEDIAKVEYSRITPARYADKGTKGLISITLRRRKDGGNISLWGRSAVNAIFMDGNFQGSYHQGKSQFSLLYNPSWRDYTKVFNIVSQQYIGKDFDVKIEQHEQNPLRYNFHQIRLKYDFQPTDRTLFSASFRTMPLDSRQELTGDTKDSFLGNYKESNTTTSKDISSSLDLYLKHHFNAKNSFEAQIVGTLSQNKYRRDYSYIFENGNADSYIMDVNNHRKSLISEINYVHDFSESFSLSGGIQNTLSHTINSYLTTDYKPLLTENNNYAYVKISQQAGRLYYSLSTGAKLFWVRNESTRRRFIRNLSTAMVSLNLPHNWNLQAYFSYTPTIPSLSALTDYPQQVSPYLVSNGNPELKVAENFNYSLSASYQYKKLTLTVNGSYSDIRNSVVDEVRQISERLFLSQSVNARKSEILKESLNFRLNGIYGFGVNLNLSISHYKCIADTWRHSLNSIGGNIYLWWNHGPLTVAYWRKVPEKYLSGQYVGKDENGDSLSISYRFGKHWKLGIDWMYMFDNKGTRYPSWNYSSVNPSTKERYIRHNGNMVVISVSYNTDFGALFHQQKRSLNNSDNGSSLLKL